MRLIEVATKEQKKEFLEFPKRHYKKDPNWICPLDAEINGIFNPQVNKKFQHGEAIRWLLVDENSKTIGRIAAFYDKHIVNHFKFPTGGCGFFECIDNQAAAETLFDAARKWLIDKGMQAMQGPINFGENYNHWGLLVEGFIPQSYSMTYNFPYYQQLFENYGFKNYFEQLSYNKDLYSGWPDRLVKFSEYIAGRPNYSFEHLKYNKLDTYVKYFVDLYNTIWAGFHDNYMPLEEDEIRTMLLEAKTILDEELLWFVFDDGKPVGFLGVWPDINQVLAKLKNGKLNLFNKLKLLYFKRRAVNRIRVFVGGVHHDYQNKGVAGALFVQLIETAKKKKHLKFLDLSWVGDYNKKMNSLYKLSGAQLDRKHITYLKLFDDNLPFERFTNEFEGKLYDYKKKKD
ncbi:MAG TPA: N-acetyltransferase [Bacteroidales bacterium]|jgi:GNAT superfamily N-acetyltransferase|nr:N-acetyltransferase [Bacteroidales bacterium]